MADNEIRPQASQTGYSPALWARCPRRAILTDRNFDEGFGFSEGFESVDTTVASKVGRLIMRSGGWRSYEDTSGTVLQTAAEGGALALVTGGADNDECSVQSGGASGAPFVIRDTAGSNYPLWYETRLQTTLVSATQNKWLAGLASEGAAAADVINDTGTDISDIDFVGFMVQEAAAVNTIDFIVQTTGGAFVKIIDTVATPSAATDLNLGFWWNGRILRIYVNGAKDATEITGTGSAWKYAAAGTALTAFPDGEELSPIFAIKEAVGAAQTMTVKWVDCVQSWKLDA